MWDPSITVTLNLAQRGARPFSRAAKRLTSEAMALLKIARMGHPVLRQRAAAEKGLKLVPGKDLIEIKLESGASLKARTVVLATATAGAEKSRNRPWHGSVPRPDGKSKRRRLGIKAIDPPISPMAQTPVRKLKTARLLGLPIPESRWKVC